MLTLNASQKEQLKQNLISFLKRLKFDNTQYAIATCEFQEVNHPKSICPTIEYKHNHLALRVVLEEKMVNEEQKCKIHVFFYPMGFDSGSLLIPHDYQDKSVDIKDALTLFGSNSILNDHVLDIGILFGNLLYADHMNGALKNAIRSLGDQYIGSFNSPSKS